MIKDPEQKSLALPYFPSAISGSTSCMSLILYSLLLALGILNFGSTRQGGVSMLILVAMAAVVIASIEVSKAYICKASINFKVRWYRWVIVTIPILFWLSPWSTPSPWSDFTIRHWQTISIRWPDGIVWISPHEKALLLLLCTLSLPILAAKANKPYFGDTLLAILSICGAACTAISMQQAITPSAPFPWGAEPKLCTFFSGPFMHHTMMGAFLNMCWPSCLYLSIKASTAGKQKLAMTCFATTGFILCGHFFHVSRMPQLLALFSLVVLLFTWRAKIRSAPVSTLSICVGFIFLSALAIAFGIGKSTQIADRWKSMVENTSNRNERQATPPIPEAEWGRHMRADLFVASETQDRLGLRGTAYKAALRAISAAPLLGHGPGNWTGAACANSQDPMLRTFFQTIQFTHNDWLQFAVEFGIPLAVAIIWLTMRPIFGLCRLRQSQGTEAIPALGLLLVGTQALWDFPLQCPGILVAFFILAGVCTSRINPSINNAAH